MSAAILPPMATDPGALLAFLGSPIAAGIDYIERADIRAVLERFLACCAELGRAPEELCAADLRSILEERLPLRYAPREKLGQRTIDVLRTFLAFLEERLPPGRARELRIALEESADVFRASVRGERPGSNLGQG